MAVCNERESEQMWIQRKGFGADEGNREWTLAGEVLAEAEDDGADELELADDEGVLVPPLVLGDLEVERGGALPDPPGRVVVRAVARAVVPAELPLPRHLSTRGKDHGSLIESVVFGA